MFPECMLLAHDPCFPGLHITGHLLNTPPLHPAPHPATITSSQRTHLTKHAVRNHLIFTKNAFCVGQVSIKDSNIWFCLILSLLIAWASWPSLPPMPCRAFFSIQLDPPGQGTAGCSHHALQLAWSLQQEIHTQLEHKQGLFCSWNYHPKVSLQKMLGWAFPQTAWKAGPPSQGSVPGKNPNAHPGSSYLLSTHWVQDDGNLMREASIQEET